MKILIAFVLVLFVSFDASAEIITLKDGRRVSGKIAQQDGAQLKLDVKGVMMTFYIDEISDIDGKPVEAPAAPVSKERSGRTSRTQPAVTADENSVGEGDILESPADKKALILKFIDVFGTRAAMTANFNAIIESVAQEKPDEAKRIREKFKIDDVIERLIPLYDKYFTAEELKAYIDFYGSPKGRKLTSNISLVMKDSIEVGAAYIKETFPELDK